MSFSMDRPCVRCTGPLSRRSLLEVGAVGLAGVGLADFLRLRAEASTATGRTEPDTSVILVWLPGGPPHMETYDMKPEAPAEYRGEFKPIQTNVSGIDVCELLPLHAKIADRFTLIRSIAHEFNEHPAGHKRMLTGRLPKSPASGTVNEAPPVGSVLAKMREHINRGVPNYIAAADEGREQVDTFAFGSAYLGPAFTPFMIGGDPSSAKFQVRNLMLSQEVASRLDDRQSLLKGLDRLRRDVDRSGMMDAMDQFSQQALNLLTSPTARRAFDLSQEPATVRERYGNHAWGQRALLARRLVEAGSSFVTAVMENPSPSQAVPEVLYNWDSHAVNCHIFKDARFRLPIFDQVVSALIEDLYARGLDKKVMVIVTGEFGRTPRITQAIGTTSGVLQPGRDHWPNAMSVLTAGGDIPTGQVIGSTNAKGEVAKDCPLSPNDLWATVYRHLGIDYTHAFLDHTGRPMPILPFGEPIHGLIS